MTDRKILFFDIDGTLITNSLSGKVPESTKEAIRLARENGHLSFVNTGRVFCCINDEIKNVGFDGFVCGCGTNVWYNELELLRNKLDSRDCREIAQHARECGFYSLFESTNQFSYDKELGEGPHSGFVDFFKSICTNIVDDIDSDNFIFDKLSSAYTKDSQRDKFFKIVQDKGLFIIDRENEFCEIIPQGFSKASGIKFLLDYFSIPLENAYAFGDSNNDLEMLELVPNSVAMGNATEIVKQKAKYITDDVDKDGIYNAMKKLNII